MKIFVIAGELSGDLHGANLVREIKKINSFVQFLGYGGNEMAEAGVDIRFELAKIPIMGFTGILKNYFILKQALNRCKEILRDEKPDAVILIDYPGLICVLLSMLKVWAYCDILYKSAGMGVG